jgi:hypothetical protein
MMTRNRLQLTGFVVVCIFACAVFGGLALRLLTAFMSPRHPVSPIVYEMYRDCLPFALVLPIMYLLYCIQKRNKFLESLHYLWSKLTHAVNAAVQYTYDEQPRHDEYDEVCILLGEAIDDVRSVYTNVKSHQADHGFYPYEPIKQILYTIRALGCGASDEQRRSEAREKIEDYWESMREDFLSEFDRSAPAKPVSHYLRNRK